VFFGFNRNPSMSPKVVRRYMRMRLFLWVAILFSSGSVLGFFVFRRWEDLGHDMSHEGIMESDQMWANRTDFAIRNIRRYILDLDEEQKRRHMEAELEVTAPDSAEAYYLRGWLALLQQPRQWEEAITFFRNASVADPKAMFPHYHLGLLYQERKSLEMAIVAFETALRLNAGFAEAHFALGSCFHEQGRLDEAMTYYGLAIRIDPMQARYHYNMGLVGKQQGRFMNAMASFTRCIQLDPSLTEAYLNLGEVQEMQGNEEEAIRMYRIFLERQPATDEREYIEEKIARLRFGRTVSP